MTRPIKLVIFDLDGTLVNAYPAVYRSINFAMKALGLPRIASHTVKRSVGWGDRHLLEKFVGPERSSKALAIYRRHHRQALRQGVTFLPGAKRLLDYLSANRYQLAVASNRPTRFSLIILRQLKIRDYFDYVLCGDKLKNPKPAPDIILRILDKLALPARQALYIGDMTIDIQTGHGAGVRTVAVTTGSCTRRELAKLKPYRVIPRVSEVVKILEGQGRNCAKV